MQGTNPLRGIGRVVCAGAIATLAGLAVAGPLGTPFEELASEVEARRNTIGKPVDRTEREQKRALNRVRRELRSVDRGLKRDLRSAVQVARRLAKAFPDDAAIGGLLEGLLDDYALELSNRVFEAEDEVDSAADLQRRQQANAWLAAAREIESFAAAAADREDHIARARHLRRLANRLIGAEKAIAFVPPPVQQPVDAGGQPIGATQGRVDYTILGARSATVAVDGSVEFVPVDGQVRIHVDAQPNDAQLSGITFDWTMPMALPRLRFSVGTGPDDARAVIRRGNVVFDRNTSGEVHIVRMQLRGGSSPIAILQATYRVSAEDALGQKVTVTGTIAIDDMPVSGT